MVPLALLVVVLALVLGSCGTSGRTLRDPAPGAKAPPRQNAGSTSTTAAPGVSTTAGASIRSTTFALTTTAWTKGASIPKAYTCEGADTSPPLTISGVPTGTVEMVLVVNDQARPDRTAWLLAGLGPATASIPQGGVPTGAIQITNSSGTARWSGPCPTTGTQTYEFAIYALSSPSGLVATSTFAQVTAATAQPLGAAVITGSFTTS